MSMKSIVQDLFLKADIKIGGTRPWDIHIHDESFYDRIADDPHMELGNTYMDELWDCKSVDAFICRLLNVKIDTQIQSSPKTLFMIFLHKIFNFQSKARSIEVAKKHYDIGNDLYQVMLDKSMNYSCGYWKHATTLEEAEQHKMELICQKLMLEPGMKLLDIGCGWGSLAHYAASYYGVEVVGLTISKQQIDYAKKYCEGLPVTFLLQDYRDFEGKAFDRVVSVGMFEHVGYKNYEKYMQIVHKNLKDDGIFLLHTIGSNVSYNFGDPWIDKHIFPNGMLPSIAQIGTAIENLFVMEDWHNFGADYDKTLMAWHHNFNSHWNQLKDKYDERFHRMWNYYLLSCAGSFRARRNQLWQIVLTKNGLKGGFQWRDLQNNASHKALASV